MCVNFLKKIRALFTIISVIKNWPVFIAIYFKLLKSDYALLELRNGIKIKLRVNSTDLMAFVKIWILHDYESPGFSINNNDVIIDVGAHIGLFALFSSQFCKNGKIYCVEPIKENFDLLRENIELNKIHNIITINAAVSTKNDTVTIYRNKDDAGHSMYVQGSEKIEVDSISLKNIFDSYNLYKCDFLKIDCEGEEYNIIETFTRDYFDRIMKISLEYHFANDRPTLLENLLKTLKSHYKTSTISGMSGMGYLYAKKN
jgi:FkbM family methyltransferase